MGVIPVDFGKDVPRKELGRAEAGPAEVVPLASAQSGDPQLVHCSTQAAAEMSDRDMRLGP